MVEEPRKILLDVTRLIWRKWDGKHFTGIDRVCEAYLNHYHRRACAVVQYPNFRCVLPAEQSQRLFAILRSSDNHFRKRILSFAIRNILSAMHTPDISGMLYLNIGHTGLDRQQHLEWVQKSGVQAIYFVHDLIPITHQQYCRDHDKARHEQRMHTVLHGASGIIGNSQYTLDQLSEFAEGKGVKLPASVMAWLGTETLTHSRLNISKVRQPYFVILGTIEGRKNHKLLLDIWDGMIKSGAPNIPGLVIIGQRGWQCEEVTDRLDNDRHLNGYVTEISDCNDELLSDYLLQSVALLFPSHIEGYGMPLLEAFSLGVPAIVSDLDVFREIAGHIPDYCSPTDLVHWEEMIRAYAAPSSPERASQVAKISKLRIPSWSDHFAIVDDWLMNFRG